MHIKDFANSYKVAMDSTALFKELESLSGGYEWIADVETQETELHETLEYAYCKSQHLRDSWLSGESIKNIQKTERVRSSSVGDVFVIDHEFYLVSMIGFKHINFKTRQIEDI